MKASNIIKLSAVMVLIILIGCAKAPQAALDSANAAIEAAKKAEVNVYFPAEFKAVQDTMNAALAMLENQKSKFFLTRNFKEVERLLNKVTSMAEALVPKMAARKEAVKAEAQGLVGTLKTGIQDAKKLLARAPRGKESKAALEAIKNDISAVEASLPEVNALLEKGDVQNAKNKLAAANQKIQSIIEELKQAIAKKGR